MDENLLSDYIPIVIRGGVIFGATIFGLAAKESLDCISRKDYKLRHWWQKVVLGLFIVTAGLMFAESVDMVKKLFPMSAALIAFSYEKLAKWLVTEAPLIILNQITRNNKDK